MRLDLRLNALRTTQHTIHFGKDSIIPLATMTYSEEVVKSEGREIAFSVNI